MEEKRDCFAWKDGNCKALNETYCKKEKCNFYICNEEYIAKRNEINKKIKRERRKLKWIISNWKN